MRKTFIGFLTSENLTPTSGAASLRTLLRRTPESIGSIAFGYGMVTAGDFDEILDEQRERMDL